MLIENNIVSPNIAIHKRNLYLIHYVSPSEFEKLLMKPYGKYNKHTIHNFLKEIQNTFKNYDNPFNNQIKYKRHTELICQGINQSNIAISIRNDDIETLQKILKQTCFDYDQKIKPSIYEKITFINQENVSLIDYAAFFSAVKCFRFLYSNHAKLENTFKYAIAGGNLEIIHLCEQNQSSFEDAYETAIMFHRNEIFKYFYENKINEIKDISKLAKKCIKCSNYQIFSYLKKNKMEIDDNIIYKTAKIGNMILIDQFLRESKIPDYILIYSVISNNIELITYILEKK